MPMNNPGAYNMRGMFGRRAAPRPQVPRPSGLGGVPNALRPEGPPSFASGMFARPEAPQDGRGIFGRLGSFSQLMPQGPMMNVARGTPAPSYPRYGFGSNNGMGNMSQFAGFPGFQQQAQAMGMGGRPPQMGGAAPFMSTPTPFNWY